MNVLLTVLRVYIPSVVKKNKLEELFCLVADAFQCEVPDIRRLSYREALEQFAILTRDEARRAIESGDDLAELRKKLHARAWVIGEKLRKRYRIRSLSEAMIMSRILYRSLGIDFRGTRQGKIVIRRCFFSGHYSPQMCDLISSVDEGIAGGLSGGGRFAFHQRITEGKDCCRAEIRFEEGGE